MTDSMKLYAVRLIDDRQPVGIFWAGTFDQLCHLVDEIVLPTRCEFVELKKPGGFCWHDKCDWQMGTAVDSEDDEEFTKRQSGISFTGTIEEAVFDASEGWTPIGDAAERFLDCLSPIARHLADKYGY